MRPATRPCLVWSRCVSRSVVFLVVLAQPVLRVRPEQLERQAQTASRVLLVTTVLRVLLAQTALTAQLVLTVLLALRVRLVLKAQSV